MPAYLYLSAAIIAEVIGTTALKASDGMSKTTPVILMYAAYAVSFYFLSIVLKTMNIGVAYAVWSAVGMVLIAFLGWVVFGEKLDGWAAVGIILIITGVVILNTLSKTTVH